MGSLYDRLDDMQHVLVLLTKDLARLRSRLGPRTFADAPSLAAAGNRRFFVRALFALVEALVQQHARLLLDLEAGGHVALGSGHSAVLSPTTYDVTDSGKVVRRAQRLSLERKIRVVSRAYETAFGQPLAVGFGDAGWQSFKSALVVRHAITHPKTANDCYVEEDHLQQVDAAEEWFRGLHNEMLRVAREHRMAHRW